MYIMYLGLYLLYQALDPPCVVCTFTVFNLYSVSVIRSTHYCFDCLKKIFFEVFLNFSEVPQNLRSYKKG